MYNFDLEVKNGAPLGSDMKSSFLSVVVLTYNHEKYIKKCLDTLLNSYTQDVELIVADDASKDKTTNVVERWLLENAGKFFNVKLIASKENNGTMRNLVKGVNASKSPFIKDIAGDDCFLPMALDYIRSICMSSKKFDAVFSPCQIAYEDDYGNIMLTENYKDASSNPKFWYMSEQEQLRALCRKNCLTSPGAFYSRAFWNHLDLGNSGVLLVEDWVMWLQGIQHHAIYIEMRTPIVVYRQSQMSVSKNVKSINYSMYLKDCALIIKNISLKTVELSFIDRLCLMAVYLCLKIFLALPYIFRVKLSVLINQIKQRRMI